MGFLDHSTNNIIVDAVLTDVGREFLARNDGSFNIVKFALSDDEIDYSVISKFGRTVGKEKIEKNAPVLEALTNGNYAQKYRLVSLSLPTLTYLPSMTLQGFTVDQISITLGQTSSVTVVQKQGGAQSIPPELSDQMYEISMNNRFLRAAGIRARSIDADHKARYRVTRDAVSKSDTTGGTSCTVTLQPSTTLTATDFANYGLTTDTNQIRTFVQFLGLQSGTRFEIEILISKSS